MQALGLVRISKKQNFVEILFRKISERKKKGSGRNFYLDQVSNRTSPLGIMESRLGSPVKAFEYHSNMAPRGAMGTPN